MTGSSGEPAQAATGHPIYLDHKVSANGSYNAGAARTEWTFGFDYFPTKAVHLATGTVFTPTRNGTTNMFYTPGNYSSGATIFGRAESMDLYLSRPFPRDENGKAIFDDRLMVRTMDVAHSRSVAFDVQTDAENQTARSTYMRKVLIDYTVGTNYGLPDIGQHRHVVQGASDVSRFIIFNNTVRPCTIVGVDFECIAMRGFR